MKFKNGISLISLVVTIIILLILIGIVIALSVDGSFLGLVKTTKTDAIVVQINDYGKETKAVIILDKELTEDNVVDKFIEKVEEDNTKKIEQDKYEIVSRDDENKTVTLQKDGVEVVIDLKNIVEAGDTADNTKENVSSRYTVSFKYKEGNEEKTKKMVILRSQTLQQYLNETGDSIPQGVTEWVPTIQYNTPVVENIEYKQYIEKIEYVMAHFNLSGGTLNGKTTVESKEYLKGRIIEDIGTPIKEYYSFVGWTPSLNDPIMETTTYTAQWDTVIYTFTFSLNGGNIGGSTASRTTSGPSGSPSNTPGIPIRANYAFNGWSPVVPSTFDQNRTFIAQWVRVFTITYNLNGGSYEGSTENQIRLVEQNTMPPELVPIKSGYMFVGWTPNLVPVTTNSTYTAIWSIPMEVQLKKQEINEEIMIPVSVSGFVLVSNNGGPFTKYTSSHFKITNNVPANTPFTVQIIGRITQWDYFSYVEKQQLYKLVAWGELGSIVYKFTGCSNLIGPIPSPNVNSFINVTYFDAAFYNCYSLTGEIPADLFANCSNVLSFQSTFQYCSSLTGSIPANLFLNCAKATSFYRTFASCNGLTGSISSNLFINCPNVIDFRETFSHNRITSIGPNLFKNTTKVVNFNYVFGGCINLTSLPSGLFDYCTDAEDFTSAFLNCNLLTSLPSNLFSACESAITFETTFQNCKGITSIPSGLFKNCTNVLSFKNTFGLCSNLETLSEDMFLNCTNALDFSTLFHQCNALTSIPADLFKTCVNAQNFQGTFMFCSNILEIPAGLFDNCPNVTNFYGTFSYCNQISSNIPAGLFDNCLSVEVFDFTFGHCKNLTGNAPALWERTGVVGNSCFLGCTNLSNYALIPIEWK